MQPCSLLQNLPPTKKTPCIKFRKYCLVQQWTLPRLTAEFFPPSANNVEFFHPSLSMANLFSLAWHSAVFLIRLQSESNPHQLSLRPALFAWARSELLLRWSQTDLPLKLFTPPSSLNQRGDTDRGCVCQSSTRLATFAAYPTRSSLDWWKSAGRSRPSSPCSGLQPALAIYFGL